LSLATQSDLRDNAGMPPDLIALFLFAGALSAVTETIKGSGVRHEVRQ